jgi:hypothetical protein
LSQEALVGVKWRWNRRFLASHAFTSGVPESDCLGPEARGLCAWWKRDSPGGCNDRLEHRINIEKVGPLGREAILDGAKDVIVFAVSIVSTNQPV